MFNIYLFADRLSTKLYYTIERANAYAAHEPDNFVLGDDFLYARCAIIVEGKEYYEKVLNDPTQMPKSVVFEPLLYLVDDAFEIKMGIPFNYAPVHNYETQSNKAGWQLT